MRRFVTLLVAAAIILVPASSGFARAGNLSVTVTYTGKGKVDDMHEIWVALFTNPDMNDKPFAVEAIHKNGGTAVFKNVTADSAYVGYAYDEKGDWDPQAGPPPQGTPLGAYNVDGKGPTLVKITAATKIKGTFDDSRRAMQ
jgi:hypothetical protein